MYSRQELDKTYHQIQADIKNYTAQLDQAHQQLQQLQQQQQQNNGTSYTAQDVRNARQRLIKAAETTLQLDAEARKRVWRSKETHDTLRQQLQAAKAEEQAANLAFTEIYQRAGWLEAKDKHDARVAEQEKERKQEQVQRAAAIEQEVRREYHDRWLINGGTTESFNTSWPSLWQSELEKRTGEGRNDLVENMKSTGRYGL